MNCDEKAVGKCFKKTQNTFQCTALYNNRNTCTDRVASYICRPLIRKRDQQLLDNSAACDLMVDSVFQVLWHEKNNCQQSRTKNVFGLERNSLFLGCWPRRTKQENGCKAHYYCDGIHAWHNSSTGTIFYVQIHK